MHLSNSWFYSQYFHPIIWKYRINNIEIVLYRKTWFRYWFMIWGRKYFLSVRFWLCDLYSRVYILHTVFVYSLIRGWNVLLVLGKYLFYPDVGLNVSRNNIVFKTGAYIVIFMFCVNLLKIYVSFISYLGICVFI